MSGRYIDQRFEWNLHIKPESSVRTGLESGSHIPRFDARIKNGDDFIYINPFTGATGNKSLTHLPLEHFYY
jgi:hypothetical protein